MKRRAVQQCTVEVLHALPRAVGAKKSKAIIAGKTKTIGVMHDVVKFIAVGMHYPFWPASGTGGVQNTTDVFRRYRDPQILRL